MHISKRLVWPASSMESLLVHPAFAADKVSLFKVITAKDEIVIGLSDDELAKMDGNAGGIAKALVAKGSLERLAICGAQSRQWRSRAGAAAQDRPDRHRVAPRRTLRDAAEGAADRRDGQNRRSGPASAAWNPAQEYALLAAASRVRAPRRSRRAPCRLG